MIINLKEDETNNYISLYRNYLEEVQRLNLKVTGVLNEIMEQSKYDKLQSLISSIIDTYTETIVNNIETGVFSTWVESDASLRACLRMYRAGDAADEVCGQIECHMNELMMDILKIEKGELIITERPVVSEDGLKQLEEICRVAQSEMVDLKKDYLAQIEVKEEDNNIYGTLKPLVEGISVRMEAFFEATLKSFKKLHEFVQKISLQMNNIAEENTVKSLEGFINGDLADKLVGLANGMTNKESNKSLSDFKKVTDLLYNTINAEIGNKKKKLTYTLIAQIVPIYHEFYEQYGDILKDKFETQEEREEFIKREYVQVTRERKNDQYFEGEEVWTFKSHAYHTYTVFNRVADMLRNIAISCEKGNADDINLLYGSYVLFTPILDGHINPKDEKKYSKFSKWAAEEILKLLGKEKEYIDSAKDEGAIDFTGENFSDENIKLFVVVVEKIVNQIGAEELNDSVEKHYASLMNSRNIYSKKVKPRTPHEYNIVRNTYGRYLVTNRSIQIMEPICEQANSILEPIDKFYKEKFEILETGFDKANKIRLFRGNGGLKTTTNPVFI